MTARMFPVLLTGYAGIDCPKQVPWSLLAPHEHQAQRNHGQDLEMLASRGGLGPDEMLAVIEDRRWERMRPEDAAAKLRGMVRAFEIIASDAVEPDRYYLITGDLSPGGRAEWDRRVRVGEDGMRVLAELLVKEGKTVAGRIE